MNKPVVDTPFSNLIREIGMKIKGTADTRLNELGLNSQQGRMIGYIFENQAEGVIQKDLAEVFNRKGRASPVCFRGWRRKGISSVSLLKMMNVKRVFLYWKKVLF